MFADTLSFPSSETGLFDATTPVPRGSLVQLTQAHAIWSEASETAGPAERFRLAHVAALRGAAAVLAARPTAGGRRAGRPTSAWQLLDTSAPELADWSAFFRSSAIRRAAIEGGCTAGTSSRDADEMLTVVGEFLISVGRVIGVPSRQLQWAS